MQLRQAALLLAACAVLAGCQKDYSAYGLTTTGSIIQFTTRKPTTINSTVTVSGLNSGQSVVQIAYRPSNGTLYCITNDGYLCTVDPSTGTASVMSTPFTQTLGNGSNSVRLSSPVISFDPVVDQLRVISTDYNLRVNPGTGGLVDSYTKAAFDSNDSNAGKTPQLTGIVYQDPVAGSSTATLFALDATTGSLLRIGDKNAGSPSSADGGDLRTVGSTGVSFSTNGGFTIEQQNGDAYAVLQQSGTGAALFTVDLGSGSAGKVGAIGDGNQTLESLVIVPGS
jgi:hypothetical protein